MLSIKHNRLNVFFVKSFVIVSFFFLDLFIIELRFNIRLFRLDHDYSAFVMLIRLHSHFVTERFSSSVLAIIYKIRSLALYFLMNIFISTDCFHILITLLVLFNWLALFHLSFALGATIKSITVPVHFILGFDCTQVMSTRFARTLCTS